MKNTTKKQIEKRLKANKDFYAFVLGMVKFLTKGEAIKVSLKNILEYNSLFAKVIDFPIPQDTKSIYIDKWGNIH